MISAESQPRWQPEIQLDLRAMRVQRLQSFGTAESTVLYTHPDCGCGEFVASLPCHAEFSASSSRSNQALVRLSRKRPTTQLKRQLELLKTLHCACHSAFRRDEMRTAVLLRGTASIWRLQSCSWRQFARAARFSAFAREPAHSWTTVQCREAVGVSQHSSARLQHSSIQALQTATDTVLSAPQVCSGCGIGLQAQNPNAPG